MDYRCDWSWLLKRECAHCLGLDLKWEMVPLNG